MHATNKQGHVWTGEQAEEWYLYLDADGHPYESTEKPAYRIVLNNATQTTLHDGTRAIIPLDLARQLLSPTPKVKP